MPDLQTGRPVVYQALSGPPDIEIVLNDRDAPPPKRIRTRDFRPAQMMRSIPLPGKPPLIPAGWKPVPGETRALVELTEELALVMAEETAEALWPDSQGRFSTQEDLAAVLYQGFLEEKARGGSGLITIDPPEDPEAPTTEEQSA